MSENTPLVPRPLRELAEGARSVMTARELRRHGVPVAAAHERCRPGGPWQMPLPGVFLLHAGPPSGDEMLRAVLGYIGGRDGEAVVTGLAGLALHGFNGAPSLGELDRMDVLVPRTRRLRSAGLARLVRTEVLPMAVELAGFPVAPVERALADAVGRISDATTARRLLTEAVRGGHCEASAVLRELARARLLGRPQVAGAVRTLLAEGRSVSEERLLDAVRLGRLPDPCWNVGLWLPDGPFLGAVDAYWPAQGVAVEIDDRSGSGDEEWRGTLAAIGVRLVRVTPQRLRECPLGEAARVRATLREAAAGPPANYLVVLPR
ncbi:hypothetical protein E1265_24845 [Streptomyces sp. 8K308]|uniref:hypothetical protein n=1 Tax=Streptomyces sp. 8K308 TaxID=2530388 RepID=UPI00104D6333|nr:hypothetical protein [Streptomyces sp. 8K308]TDC18792.1 hypothetical protein E1265_24845 [Streptomyces sp. 8K308]